MASFEKWKSRHFGLQKFRAVAKTELLGGNLREQEKTSELGSTFVLKTESDISVSPEGVDMFSRMVTRNYL